MVGLGDDAVLVVAALQGYTNFSRMVNEMLNFKSVLIGKEDDKKPAHGDEGWRGWGWGGGTTRLLSLSIPSKLFSKDYG